MSTMSFLRKMTFKKARQVSALVKALERSEREPKREVKYNRPVREVRGEQVKDLLAETQW